MKNRILVIEDDTAISELISMNLTVAGYDTEALFDGNEVEEFLKTDRNFDLALLDVMLPGKDGLRAHGPYEGGEDSSDLSHGEKRRGLEDPGTSFRSGGLHCQAFRSAGASGPRRKVLERTGRQISRITVGDIEINLNEHQVTKNGQEVSLKPLEYDLLVLLAKNKNMAFTREQLLNQVWGSDYLGETRTVDVHIGQLRKKLELFDVIKTIPKIGYRLED